MLQTRLGKQYRCEMEDEEHEELLDVLLRHNGFVAISGYDTELYNSKLVGWNKCETVSFSQTCSRKREVLWMNYDPPGRQMEFEDMEGRVQ